MSKRIPGAGDTVVYQGWSLHRRPDRKIEMYRLSDGRTAIADSWGDAKQIIETHRGK